MLLRARLSSSPCARGIKAIKVVAKEGGKANGEVTIVGVKKRVVFGLVLVATVVAVCFTLTVNEEKERKRRNLSHTLLHSHTARALCPDSEIMREKRIEREGKRCGQR